MVRYVSSIISPSPIKPQPSSPIKSRKSLPAELQATFQESLQKEIGRGQGLKFSAHAEKRLKERQIVLAQGDLQKINNAVKQAEAKGSRESLIIYGDLALVASVRNRTVVTAVDGKSAGDHVFTNIDSAVIVK